MIRNISRFIAALALLATAQGAWAEWTGTGTSADPYIISTPEDLLLLAHRVNGTSGETVNTYQGKFFKLGADITFDPDALTLDEGQSNYEAIGHYDGIHEFKGNFNGDGHTVSGIRINKTGSGSANNCQGLFGLIASGAEIHDVHLTDARITGYDYVAGIVAYNFGTVSGCTVTDSYITYNAFDHGTICARNGGTLTNNYYHGCTVNGTAVTSGKGCGGSDLAANNGALPAYAITFGDGVSTTALASVPENGFVYNGVSYYREGLALPLASTHASEVPAGYTLFSANGTAFSGSDYTVSATDGDVTITTATTISIDPAQFSVNDAGTEYTIHTAGGWNVFCDLLADNAKGYFSGKTVNLGANITVTRMAGGQPFTSTFDGGGHTLTLAYGTADAPIDAQFVAPFVETANDGEHQPTFRNLTIGGTIYDGYTGSEAHNVGGLIGHLYGNVTIEHCTSFVEIHAKVGAGGFVGLCEHNVSFTDCHSAAVIRSADGSNSGFVAWSRASEYTIAFTGCLFDGKLLQQNGSGSYNGGFIGWTGASKTVTITNSLCAPAPLATGETMASSGSATFARGWNATTTATNSYDTAAFEIAQGKATRTVTADADVTIGAIALTGTATQYTVSGITAYSGGGLQHGETLYYGSGDQLSLTLSKSATGAPRGYRYDGYTASAGTLSGTTLTMPDEDVTISVALAPIDWATVNQGDSKYPYMIYNKDQLLLLAHRVNGTNGETANTYEGKYFKLGADITFTHDADKGDNYDENYEAIGGYIGGYTRYFNGKFDGDGHTVSGIHIRKDGTGDADFYQGLFGQIGSRANIHDVHLTDARIKGYYYVGGIVGFNTGNSIVSGCTVTNSHITATGEYYGTICGFNADGTLRNNYYHGCTVNSTAVTSGKGCEGADIADDNGALPAYRLALGENITTPPGTFVGQTEWLDTPPDGARLAPENGFTLAGNHYFSSGYVFTPGSTLASDAAQGYTPRATLGGQLLPLYTTTDDAPDYTGTAIARLTISDECDGKTLSAALRSDGQEHEVSYIKADGTPDEASAIALDGTETSLAAGWYFVGKDIDYNATLTLGGDVNLILCGGCEMKVGESDGRISGRGISGYSKTLDIYAQSLGDDMGALSIYNSGSNNAGIYVKALTVNGGNITVDANGSYGYAISATTSTLTVNGGNVTANSANSVAIHSGAKIYINGGTVNATGDAQGISGGSLVEINGGTVNATCTGSGYGIRATGSLAINGGNVTASSFFAGNGTITLGWTRPADRITASSISTGGGTVAVADGQALTDGSGHIYTGTLSADDLAALAGKTLQPWLVLNETNGVTPLTALAGQTNVPVIFTRTFSANVASTICLPFAISAEQAAAAGKFYTFAGVDTSGSEWVVTMQETNATNDALAANTPYLFMPSASREVTFSGTIGNVADTYTAGTTNSGKWTYQGTYETIEWESDPRNIYGFASGQAYGDSGDQTEAGKFIRVHTGGIRPFRAYLEYAPSAARALSRSATDGLPETMTVRLIGSNGQTTAIGTLDTRTGDVTFGDEWYTLDGRRLSGQPTAKGIYIYKGKKVIIK